MTEKKFASQADLVEKKVSFDKLSDHAYAYTAEGDPNTGIVVGDNAVMVIDTQATPVMAQDVIRRIREVTDKPIRYVVLSHYHAVRVLGATAYNADHVIASRDTYDLIVERGEQDMKSEIERFPRLFRAVESVPGLTWPNLVFKKRLTLWLGKLQVEIMQLGRGHTKGDTVVWLPQEKILFSGDLVEYEATPYTGDAYLADWPDTLDNIAALKPAKLVPGRGAALMTPEAVKAGLDGTDRFVSEMFACGEARGGGGQGPEQRVQGNLCGAEAEVRPLGDLRPLPAVRRDARLRRGDAIPRSADLDGATRQGNVGNAGRLTIAIPASRMKTYANPVYPYARPAELDAPGARRPVVIVGAGPVGLAAAIDLGQRGVPVVVLDDDRTVSVGSRAICYAKRALEILDRLGCGQKVVDKGIGWNVGKVFFRDELVYRFDLLPEPGHRRPAFVNLQQYWFEEYLVERARAARRGRAALGEQGRRRRAAARTAST